MENLTDTQRIVGNNRNNNSIINLRGLHEQVKFATQNWHGGAKGCFTKGCAVVVPLEHAIKGVDLSNAIVFRRMFQNEDKASLQYAECYFVQHIGWITLHGSLHSASVK